MLLSLFPITGLISSHGCSVRTARQHRPVAACGTRLQLLPWSLPASLSQENSVKFIVIVSSGYFVLPGCGSFTTDFCQDFLPIGNSKGPAGRGLWGRRVVQCPRSPTSCVPQPPVRWAGPRQAPWPGLATAQLCPSLGEGLQQGPAWGPGPRAGGSPRGGLSPAILSQLQRSPLRLHLAPQGSLARHCGAKGPDKGHALTLLQCFSFWLPGRL